MRVVHVENLCETFILEDLSGVDDGPVDRDHAEVENECELEADVDCREQARPIIDVRVIWSDNLERDQNYGCKSKPVWEIAKLKTEFIPPPKERKHSLDTRDQSKQ